MTILLVDIYNPRGFLADLKTTAPQASGGAVISEFGGAVGTSSAMTYDGVGNRTEMSGTLNAVSGFQMLGNGASSSQYAYNSAAVHVPSHGRSIRSDSHRGTDRRRRKTLKRVCLTEMHAKSVIFVVLVALLSSIATVPAHAQASTPSETAAADTLFHDGKFAQAQAEYLAVWNRDDKSFQAAKRLGALALFSNERSVAEAYLNQAHALKPDDPAVNNLLGECYYRRDDFSRAAGYFEAAGDHAKAEKLASFQERTPYQVQGADQSTALPFLPSPTPETGDLPVVEVHINGGRTARFLIDTGGAEVLLDGTFAKEAGAKTFDAVPGTFAGGKQASVVEGRIDSLTLGTLVVRNVPVQVIDLAAVKIDGIIGTVLLYHFLSTIDYPGRRLILRRIGEHDPKPATDAIIVPFRMAGDHYMVAQGTVNGSAPVLFLVDTGLNGGGFVTTPAEAALLSSNLKKPVSGIGGGGATTAIPFVVNHLTLGDAAQQNIGGMAMDGFPEYALGFHLTGLVSHDFFKPYAVTFDFAKMQIILSQNNATPKSP